MAKSFKNMYNANFSFESYAGEWQKLCDTAAHCSRWQHHVIMPFDELQIRQNVLMRF